MMKPKKMHFYPPARAKVLPVKEPGRVEDAPNNQLFRKTGKIYAHKYSPQPWPAKRFHQGESTDLFVLKGGTKNYKDAPGKSLNVPDKDIATFYGMKDKNPKLIGDKTKFGESVMRFFGDGTNLEQRIEREKETISEATSKFHCTPMPQGPKNTMNSFGRKTLKQETRDQHKMPLSYQDVYQEVYGNTPGQSKNGEATKVNLFTRT